MVTVCELVGGPPIVLDSPHRGRHEPRDFDSVVPLRSLLHGEDSIVERLLPALEHGVTLVAEIPRIGRVIAVAGAERG